MPKHMTTVVSRLWRRMHPGGNPLARTSDRVESWILTLAVIVSILAMPFVAALGSDNYARDARVAEFQQSTRYETTAVLLGDAPSSYPTTYPGSDQTVPVQAQWKLSDGHVRTGTVSAQLGAKKNSDVSIWVDRAGNPVRPPMTTATAAWNAAAIAVTVWAAIVAGCSLVYWVARGLLDHVRYEAWQREWDQLERQRHKS